MKRGFEEWERGGKRRKKRFLVFAGRGRMIMTWEMRALTTVARSSKK